MGRPRPTAGEKIARADWVRTAVRLSGKGWSLRRVAERVGKSHEAVRKALREEYERVRPTVDEIEALRSRHAEKLEARESRLNRLTAAYWTKAKGGDAEAAKVVLDAEKGLDRVHVSQARLLGLDAPAKEEVVQTVSIDSEVTPSDVARAVREVFGTHAAVPHDAGPGAGAASDVPGAGAVPPRPAGG